MPRGRKNCSRVAVRRVRADPQGRGYNVKKIFAKIVDVKPNEVRALWLGFVFFFVVLAGYYVIRPVRDNIGATQFENLWWMFTVVLVTMIAANALFSMIVARMSRRAIHLHGSSRCHPNDNRIRKLVSQPSAKRKF